MSNIKQFIDYFFHLTNSQSTFINIFAKLITAILTTSFFNKFDFSLVYTPTSIFNSITLNFSNKRFR